MESLYYDIDETRRILHRDNLPKTVALNYRGELNTTLRSFLNTFESTFDVQFDEDMDPLYTSADTLTPQAVKFLSGGQKVVLSIAFGVTMWSIFLRDVRLLVFDEPTQFLDEKHMARFADFVRHLRTYCEQSASQIILVSHHRELQELLDFTYEVKR